MRSNIPAGGVAVVIVNWNSGELLDRCLGALGRQTERPRRILIVDNGSTDGSAAGLEERHPGVEVMRTGVNTGFAAANNLAVRAVSDCEWIALLNPDAFPDPTWLARLMEAGRVETAYAFFASRLLLAAESDRLDGAGDSYSINGLAWRRGHGQPAETMALEPEEVFGPCAAAALYRRDAFLEVGGFDETFFCYFEDLDLAFRLRLAGYRCLYVPGAVVHHIGSALTGRRSDFSLYHGHRNLVWTFVKNMPLPMLLAYLPHHLLLNLVSLVFFSLRGRARVIVRAKWDALRGLPRAWRARARIHPTRKVALRELRRSMTGAFSRPYLRRAAS